MGILGSLTILLDGKAREIEDGSSNMQGVMDKFYIIDSEKLVVLINENT